MRNSVLISLLSVFSVGLLAATLFLTREPEPGRLAELSNVIRSDSGEIINLRLTPSGHWREPADIGRIDPALIKMLIAYEDKRFWNHHGVDPFAIVRASLSLAKSGKVKSGASTLTMQTAKLMYPDLRQRTITNKLKQMLFAIRLDAHWSKQQILEAYFTLAPFGGNIEGIEAATQAWFQKSPKELTYTEAALLVALPQSPERRRPDLFPEAAFKAKTKVLEAVAGRIDLKENTLEELKKEPLPVRLSRVKSIALHLADRLEQNSEKALNTSINAEWQRDLNSILKESAQRYIKPINLAGLIVERKTGYVKAYAGSSSYTDSERKGSINYLTATRSPGSTLKPLIYAKALERKLLEEGHIFNDSILQRGGYTPSNFDKDFYGQITLKEALNRSLNIPAIQTLELLGADRFENHLRTFVSQDIGQNHEAGLTLAVGGFYLNAENLIEVYLEMADPGFNSKLRFNFDEASSTSSYLISSTTSEKILRLMSQRNTRGEIELFKTGTSHNQQDAWVVNIFEDHIVLVWLGTPDNEPTPNLTGRSAALPISKAIQSTLGLEPPKIENDYKVAVGTEENFRKCGKLIEYPEDGEWIRGNTLSLSVSGNSSASWYLNNVKLSGQNQKVKLPNAGVNKITAVMGNCRDTSEVFFQLTN